MNATIVGPYGPTTLEPAPYPFTIGRAPDNQHDFSNLLKGRSMRALTRKVTFHMLRRPLFHHLILERVMVHLKEDMLLTHQLH
jgi:hypothetical protein